MASHAPTIDSIEAFIVVGEKNYARDAGLTAVSTSTVSDPQRSSRALATVLDLHVCVYPPQAQSVLVRITASDGTFGWGEAHAPLGPRATKAVIEDVLAPILLGKSPFAIEHHWEKMYGSMRLRGHVSGYQMEAVAGIDIALWDLVGKLQGVPVYQLLGGPFRTELPAYASGIPGATIDERIESANRFIAEGYTAMKASIGRGDIDSDVEGVTQLAEAIRGRADLLVDAHGAYAMDSALWVGRKLQEAGVHWLEDPLPPEDLAGYRYLVERLDLAIAAGETDCTRWQVRERLRTQSVSVLLPDICRAGGISEGRKIATAASLFNTRWAAHVSMGTSVHVAAAAHLAASSANFLIFEFPSGNSNPIGDRLLTSPLHPVCGYLAVPDGPGLGIEFDKALLAEHIWNPEDANA
jgi:L-alanine-DL-glutamate epimerase-like enolase superfamily enzyme